MQGRASFRKVTLSLHGSLSRPQFQWMSHPEKLTGAYSRGLEKVLLDSRDAWPTGLVARSGRVRRNLQIAWQGWRAIRGPSVREGGVDNGRIGSVRAIRERIRSSIRGGVTAVGRRSETVSAWWPSAFVSASVLTRTALHRHAHHLSDHSADRIVVDHFDRSPGGPTGPSSHPPRLPR